MTKNNKYAEAVSKAYENKELDMLLGCSGKYCMDENGRYYTMEDIRLSGRGLENSDPIDFEALLSAVESYYCSLDRKSGEKRQFINSFTNAVLSIAESNSPDNIYFATRIYFILAERENANGYFYPLEGVYKNLKSKIELKVLENINELKSVNKYMGKFHEEGLWSIIKTENNIANEAARLKGI